MHAWKRLLILYLTLLKVTIELIKSTLFQPNLQLNRLSTMRSLLLGPPIWHKMFLLNSVRRAGNWRHEDIASHSSCNECVCELHVELQRAISYDTTTRGML